MDQIENPIAERELIFTKKTGEKFLCKILLGEIKPDENDASYICPCQLIGYGRENIANIHGTDSLQALTLGLEIIHIWLNAISKDDNGEFTWLNNSPQILPRDLWKNKVSP